MRHQELRQVRLEGFSSLIEIFVTISLIALEGRIHLIVDPKARYIGD